MSASEFDLLCQELYVIQARREAKQARIHRQPPRPLAKAAPVKPPDFDRLAKSQAALAAAIEKSHALHTQDRIRDSIEDLRKAARCGQLSANSAAKLDVLIGRAAAMGLRP